MGVRDRSNSARATTTCGMERNSDPERSKQCSAALPAAVDAHVDRLLCPTSVKLCKATVNSKRYIRNIYDVVQVPPSDVRWPSKRLVQ